jgi:hypothetical protein
MGLCGSSHILLVLHASWLRSESLSRRVHTAEICPATSESMHCFLYVFALSSVFECCKLSLFRAIIFAP